MTQPLANVHPDARIAPGVVIDPFVTVEADVEIGEGTHLHPGAVALNGARIGRNCTIHSGAVVAGVPQDLKFKGEQSLAIIGDGTTLRECATVNRGTASKGKTIVGSNCLIMAYSHVAHDCVVGSNVIIANASQVAGEVEIGDWAVIGGGSLIHQFSRIGAHVMMQGGSLVNKDVPPFTLCARYPISYAGVNIIGLRRRGFSAEAIGGIQEIYRIIFQSGLNTTEALAQVEATIPASAERDQILDFIRLSTRGILKGYN
jgi:UDP-N-acetylglucosamine acyltransferase